MLWVGEPVRVWPNASPSIEHIKSGRSQRLADAIIVVVVTDPPSQVFLSARRPPHVLLVDQASRRQYSIWGKNNLQAYSEGDVLDRM